MRRCRNLRTHPQLPKVNGALYATLYGPGHSGADAGISQKVSYDPSMTTRRAIDEQIVTSGASAARSST